ncbi:MAG TPA: hypothetical protein VGH19_17065 [Verrucomicrobiae bacterium]
MSLINDALKRANEAQKNQPVAGPLGAPLQPADAPMRRGSGGGGSNWSPVLVPAIVVVLLALGFWFIRSGLQNKPSTQPVVAVTAPVPPPFPVAPPAPVAPVPAPAHVAKAPEKSAPYVSKSGIKVSTEVVTRELPPEPAFEPTPVKIEVPTPAPAPVVAAAVEPKMEAKAEPVVAVTTTPQPPVTKTEPVAPVKPAFPELKLQGIFYRPNNPSALVSGKNVRIGELVQGAKVVAIERNKVVLEFKGERREMTLDVQ